MAFEDDLRSFLESRLLAFDPAIDLSDNSPAQLQIIAPTLARFGEDPFSTDIPTFIKDRLIQEFPELAADNGGLAEDILSKPFQLLMEPFKREIELVKIGDSFANAEIMADAEADALGANWFEDRDAGDFASGPVRLYFAQPSTTRVGTDKRLSTNAGLSFFPIQNYYITAQQMAFNRQGSFYFLDIVVRAETEGLDYNVARSAITSIQDVPAVVKVANLTDFISGRPKESNIDFISRIETSLTERSFVTKRGILAQIPSAFDSVRALQIIGAGDVGMDRDILTGTGQGYLHMVGSCVVSDFLLLTDVLTFRDGGLTNSFTPQPGDQIRYRSQSDPGPTALVATITSLVISTGGTRYLFLLDTALVNSVAESGYFALFKPGFITISGVPGGISADVEVADNTVHLGGHTDVFARPTQDVEVQTTVENVTDDNPLDAITDLTVPTAGQNLVHSDASNWENEVLPGDILVIETGAGFAGSYQILEVANTDLRVSSIFPLAMATHLRARIVRKIRLDLVSPKIPKLPFTNTPVSDLQTNVGSNEFNFSTINIQDYSAKQGDTINVLEGPDAGEFTIIGFGPVAGNVVVDRAATSTGSNISYEVYTKQNGITRPLVRVKGLEVLDSTGQTTGITVPYGDAVDIRPDCNFEGAGHDKTTYDKQLIIFPDLTELSALTSDPASLGSIDQHVDARYTLGFSKPDGVVRKVTNYTGNQIRTTEINVPPFVWNGEKDKIMALVSHVDVNYPGDAAGTHKTSDLADAKIGDTLTIDDGPNQGKYIITDHRILDLWGKTDVGHRKVAVIRIDPPLKVDPIRAMLNLINYITSSTFFSATDLYGFFQYAADWDNASGFYTTFLTELQDVLHTGLSMTGFDTVDDTKAFLDPLIRCGYSVGPAATGTFRTYFEEPVSIEFYAGTDPTTFDLASDGSKKFRVALDPPPAQIIPESVIETAPALWNRNLGTRIDQDNYGYATSGSSFASRGVRAGDTLEYYPAINDLPARGSMTSSWLCVTQAGSNIIQLILPQSNGTDEQGYGGVDNFVDFSPGQLIFLDSGPDIGSFVITKILDQNWGANPPVIRVQIDQPLTHTTENFPVLSTSITPPSQADFSSNLPAFVQGTALTFPLSLHNKHLKVETSTNAGSTWTTVEHTFGAADPYNTIADVVADINGDGTFAAVAIARANGAALDVISVVNGPRTRIRIDSSPTITSAHPTLGLTNGTVGAGARGAGAVPGTKRLYGTGLSQFQINDWVTVYAANDTSIITNGDDTAVIGTYKVTAVGNDESVAPFWATVDAFIELERTDNFPAGSNIIVRWIRHGIPDTEPANTTDGGKEISDQFIRFRAYDSVAQKNVITDLPWDTASIHPLLTTSEQQIELTEPGLVDVGDGQRNYAYMVPYRIIRDNLLRISSTDMALQREGALYYVDIPVIGYGPGSDMNVTPADGFVVSGNRKIDGYTLEVAKEIYTFSTSEDVHILLPNSVLPVGSTSAQDNLFNLSGQTLQITYNNAPLIEDLQTAFESSLDRVTAANMLVRHFLPGYVFLDATYSGGSTEADVATELIKYINNIDPDTAEIRTDLLQDIIKRKGAGTADLPLTVIVLFHGIDRRIRAMRSTKSVGIGDSPFFKGNFKQTYFIAGPDTSGQSPRPTGEQVFLKRT